MKSPSVYIIVLNWNNWEDTVECLESLQCVEYPNFRIVVVDNASSDNSVDKIKEWAGGRLEVKTRFVDSGRSLKPLKVIEYFEDSYEKQQEDEAQNSIVLIRNCKNLGFAAGNNTGIRYGFVRNADYILLLNNDTAVTLNFLTELVEFAEKQEFFGAACSKILDYSDESDWQWPVSERFSFGGLLIVFTGLNRLFRKTVMYNRWFYKDWQQREVYAIPGSCIFMKSSVLKDISLLDEKTFLYWEEFILAEKLKARNLKTYIVPQSVIYHKLGRTTNKIGARKFIENFRSEGYFFSRYLGMPIYQKIFFLILSITAYSVRFPIDKSYRKKEHLQMFLKEACGWLTLKTAK